MANQLSSVAPLLLPPTITGPIFQKAKEASAVQSLAQRVPLAVNAHTAIPISLDVPRAGWVVEGGVKPTGSAGVGVKTMVGKKVALLLPVSEEVAMTNPAGLYTQLENSLPTAIARAFDYACIHGKDYATGGAGPFADYLAKTPNSQVIGATAAASGGVYADLVLGERQVVDGPMSYDFTGFAADPRLRPELKLSVDVNGRPLMVDAYPGANVGEAALMGSLIGYPVAYNAGVSGVYRYSGEKVQTVTVNGTPTGGTFTLTIGGYTTSAIAYNASAATVQTAIQALAPGTPFGGGPASAATVTGSAGGPYTVTFSAVGAPISADGSALTGGTGMSVTTAQATTTDTGLRAIGGDWSQCAYGVGMDISIKISTEASYVDANSVTHSAFQENLVLLLCEAYYGFVVADVNAYVAYTHSAGS
jgi:hypothetical protein